MTDFGKVFNIYSTEPEPIEEGDSEQITRVNASK